jgi:hypothetical protein
VDWTVTHNFTDEGVSAMARPVGDPGLNVSIAQADALFPYSPIRTFYRVDAKVPAFRFSRVKAKPLGEGGGTAALTAALEELDRRGAWAVLEAQPYDRGTGKAGVRRLVRYYERFGFKVVRTLPVEDGPCMSRPPGGVWEDDV